MGRTVIVVLLMLLAGELAAQRIFERKRPEIIPTDGSMRRGGCYFAPGITYTLTRFSNKEEEVFDTVDTTYTATYDPNGRIGLYLEAGWFHATRDPIILDYWDIGLAYKQLAGAEAFEGLLVRGEEQLTTTGEGSFNERYLTAHANANKFIQTTDRQFVQLSLGANVDYSIGSAREHSGDSLLNQHEFPPDLIGQFHIKVGYGFKVSRRLLIIPALETPVFSVLPTDRGFGQMQWFSSQYRPVILSVRFLFLRYLKGFACPPVKGGPDEKEKHKIYRQENYHP